jgi:hypothetical protein
MTPSTNEKSFLLRSDDEFADVAALGDGAMDLAGFLEVVRLGDHGGEVAALHEASVVLG